MGHLILMVLVGWLNFQARKKVLEPRKLNSLKEHLPLSVPGFIKVSELISKLLFTFVFLSANPQKKE